MSQPLFNFQLSRVFWLSSVGCLLSLGAIAANTAAQTPPSTETATPAEPVTVTPKILPSFAPATPEIIAPTQPEPAISPDLTPAPTGSGAFIDRTDYNLGATERTEPPAVAAQTGKAGAALGSLAATPVPVTPVQVQNYQVSGVGSSWSTVAPANPIGQAYSTVRDFYNRTVRPIGRIGNGDLRMIFPLSIPTPITSLFGWRIHPITGGMRFHAGTDMGAPMGTPVLAALTGRVIFADLFGGYGLSVGLEHNDGNQQTLYAHLSELFVKPGEIVKQGTVIGRVGSTGASTGPHLHFEFRQQTTDGWVAMDAGLALETAMAELAKSMQVAQKPSNQTTP